MALSYPLEFPDQPFAAQRCRFSYETFGAMSRTQAGTITFQEFIGGSLWEAFYQTKPLNERNFGRWHAFVLGLRGNRSFKAYDPRRCQPIAYTATNLPSFTPSVTAAGGSSISVSGFPAGFIITAGDYISFAWRNAQALVKFLEGATIGGGGSGTFEVGPTLLAGGTVPITATVVRPWTHMKLKPGTLQVDRSHQDQMSFEAIQTMG